MLKTFLPTPSWLVTVTRHALLPAAETANLEIPNRRGHPRRCYYLSSIIPAAFSPKGRLGQEVTIRFSLFSKRSTAAPGCIFIMGEDQIIFGPRTRIAPVPQRDGRKYPSTCDAAPRSSRGGVGKCWVGMAQDSIPLCRRPARSKAKRLEKCLLHIWLEKLRFGT
jgi:hypothetical protein